MSATHTNSEGILRLSHADVRVPDLELAVAYYSEVVGLVLTGHDGYDGLFATILNRRLELEGCCAETAGDMIYTFVIYLELIKHVVGVSFTLGWIAGIMFCWEYLGHKMFLIPFGASLAVSTVVFLVTFGISSFVDNLHWPSEVEYFQLSIQQ